MRLLLDQGLPRTTPAQLANRGVSATHVAELGLSTASDRELLAYARAKGLVVVTLDADFHALLALSGHLGPSVVRIRREGLNGATMAELIADLLPRIAAPLTAGAVVSVNARGARIHRLPMRSPDSQE